RRQIPPPTITAGGAGRPVVELDQHPETGMRVWTVLMAEENPLATELLLEHAGSIVPLAPAPGDDIGLDIHPSGRHAVFHTTRFEEGSGSFDLAIVELPSGNVRPLLVSPDIEAH